MRHAKLLVMVGGLLLATSVQGQVLFDENFEYTPTTSSSGSFPGTTDASWTLIGGSPHFGNAQDINNELWATGEIGSGVINNFHGTTGAAKKDLTGGAYTLSNLVGNQVVRASWTSVHNSSSRVGNTVMKIRDNGGTLLAKGDVVYNGGSGREIGLLVTSAGGGTDYIDLNSGVEPNPRQGPGCSSTNFGGTQGCNAFVVEAHMELTGSTVRAAARFRLWAPAGGGYNETDGGLVISSNLLTHSLTDVRTISFATNGGLGEFHGSGDNYKVQVANSFIPEPATLSLLGLGSLLLMRRRRRA